MCSKGSKPGEVPLESSKSEPKNSLASDHASGEYYLSLLVAWYRVSYVPYSVFRQCNY